MSKLAALFRSFAASMPLLKSVSLVVCAAGFSNVLQAQEQERLFSDEFDLQTPNLVQSANNLVIDRNRGEVQLAFFDSTVTTPRNYQLNLDGVESAYNGLKTIRTVVDIDVLPSSPNLYLVTDAGTNTVFVYNRVGGAIGTTINLNFAPKDAFPYRENGRLKILVVGSDPANSVGRVIKYDIEAIVTPEWEYKVQNASFRLDNPSDVFVFTNPAETNHPNQVLICDTGNGRLVAVDTTSRTDAGIQILQGTGVADFDKPVDLEAAPNERDVLLVTDQGKNRVVLAQRNGATLTPVWDFGLASGLPDSTQNALNSPSDADAVRNSAGTILISDAGNNRIIEVDRQKQVVFCYGKTTDKYCFGRTLFGLTDADRIDGRRTVAVFKDKDLDSENTVPRTLAYTTQALMSEVFSFRRAVDFDSLLWSGLDGVNGGLFDSTRIRLQMRSSNSPSNFQLSASQFPFFGPDSVRNFYEQRRAGINRRHDGDSLFQFLIHLETSNPQHTPVLTGITATGRFFRARTGELLSVQFGAPQDSVITSWVSLNFPNRGRSITVEILDAANNNKSLASFPETDNSVTSLLTLVPSLLGKQKLRLRATFKTTESFISSTTPVLENWRMVYRVIPNIKSRTSFTDGGFQAVSLYKLAGVAKDSVYVSVTDPSLIQTLEQRQSVNVSIKSALTEDSVNVVLKLNPNNVANFRGGLPVAFKPSRNNDTLEVKDRDVLIVRYLDPFDGTDISADTARVLRRTSGKIRIESLAGTEIDSIFVDNFFVVRVFDEKDQDLSSTKKDTIYARAYVEGPNREEEKLTLVETGDTTGVFLSFAVFVQKDRSADNDRRLRVFNNDDVVAEYIDPDNGEKVIDAIKAFGGNPDEETIFKTNAAFDFMIAPNPYRTYQHNALKLAARVQTGKTLTLEQVEIFNLASEKVTTLAQGQIVFNGSTMVTSGPSVTTTGWWNRTNDNGALVASGTYFVKFHVRITDNNTNRSERASLIRKLVLVQ